MMVGLPPDLDDVLEEAWQKTRRVPGYLGENEARFLGILAACAPAEGAIVEIGSFKGKSTVMLASVAAHYGLGPVVAINPTTHHGRQTLGLRLARRRSRNFLYRCGPRDWQSTWRLTAPFREMWPKDGSSRFVCCGSMGIIHSVVQKKISICSQRIW